MGSGKKDSDEEKIPVVSVAGMTGTTLVTLNSFSDLKIVAKTLKKPIQSFPRLYDTQKFFVMDEVTRYVVEVKIEGVKTDSSTVTLG